MSVQTTFDLIAANAALKELYDGQVVESLTYKNNPFMAMVGKMTEFGGKYMPVPIITNTSQGRSADFAEAQANQTAVEIESFALTRKTDYSIARIDQQTLLASRTDKMAFVQGAKTVIDGAIRVITNSIASAMFRDGNGTLGTIASISGGVVTLSNPSDIVQFERNQKLEGRSGGVATGIAQAWVIAVNRTAGTFTVSTSLGGSAGTPTGWAAGVTVNVVGDYAKKLSGLAAWLPFTAPTTGDDFYGVDRSIDPTRLAGVRYDGSLQSVEEALIDASLLVAREGGMPDVCIMSYASYAALEKSLGAKAQYISFKGPAEIMFPGILINGANGQIKVFPDRNCPGGFAYLLQMDTWKLYSLNDAPHISKYADGLEMLRVGNSDSAELRVAAYANLGCTAPGWNAVVKLGA